MTEIGRLGKDAGGFGANSRSPVFLLLLAALAALPPLILPLQWMNAASATFEKGCPVFSEPRIGADIVTTIQTGGQLEVLETRKHFLKELPPSASAPLLCYVTFYKLKMEDAALSAWASPNLELDLDSKTVKRKRGGQTRFLGLAAFSFIGLIASLAMLLQARRGKWGLGQSACLLFAAIFLRQTLLGLYLGHADAMMLRPNDECSYFRIGRDIADWNWGLHEKWNYTIGFPILMIPFLLSRGAADIYCIVEEFSVFNAFCVSTACIALVFLIVKSVSKSDAKAFIVAAILAAMPFLYYPFEAWSFDYFRAFFIPPGFIVGMRPYYLFHWTGFNALSDTPSSAFALLCILLSLRMKGGLLPLISVSALFGFACMVRVNNVMFAPLLAYLFMQSNIAQLKDAAFAWKAVAASLGGFLLLFLPQLMANAIDSGSPFSLPYLFHGGDVAKGFLLSAIPFGSKFLFLCNALYVVAGILGVMFMRDVRKRTVFALWAFPLLLFFCGYPAAGNNPVRFLLPVYGALLGAFVCCDAWPERRAGRIAALMTVALTFLLVVPPLGQLDKTFRTQPFGLMSGGTMFSLLTTLEAGIPPISLLTAFLLLRKERRSFLFLALLSIIYCAGYAPLLFLLALALLALSLFDFGKEAWREMAMSLIRRKSAGECNGQGQ